MDENDKTDEMVDASASDNQTPDGEDAGTGVQVSGTTDGATGDAGAIDGGEAVDDSVEDGGTSAVDASDDGEPEDLDGQQGQDTAQIQDGVLDLRPAAESAKCELLRLGLTYDRTDGQTGVETWRDYQRHLAAVFPATDGEPITVTDLRTGISRTLSLAGLRDVREILVTGEGAA